ncbi:MAG TPA: GNAT family N-acetyltransferase [Lactovum miscens]|uniref:GNAT family N-acetyltransferase n=1 Tax=Lactovum miscens TaxID=190387 RepID=UPI002ED7DC84
MEYKIRTLNIEDKNRFEKFNNDLLKEKKSGFRYSLSTIKEINNYEEYLVERNKLENYTIIPNYSTMTTFYYFDGEDICAKIDCRWELDKGNLSTEGGHIGYITSPNFRGKGIMYKLLTFALTKYNKRNIKQVFITALKDNRASRATIEKVGGILDSYYEREDGEIIARYWVTTT